MVSVRFVALCATGLAGSLFLGYCVYFDQKRRKDPDYKKKVLARRRNAKKGSTIDLRDPKVRQEFLTSEMIQADRKLNEGKLEEAVGHYINVVAFSGDPKGTLMMLQRVVPAHLYSVICRTYAVIMEQSRKSRQKKDDEMD